MTGCAGPCIVHTVGHSTRSIERFLGLLAAHQIALVVDVRRFPSSRRFPHFSRDVLGRALAETRVGYWGRQDLGGYRRPAPDSPNRAWRTGAFRAYADFMATPAFEAAMDEVERQATAHRLALLCAEAVPWRCHRQLLADALLVRGWTVRHVFDDRCEAHRLPPFARTVGSRVVYPADAS